MWGGAENLNSGSGTGSEKRSRRSGSRMEQFGGKGMDGIQSGVPADRLSTPHDQSPLPRA